jgi:hypothetical protein
MPTKRKKAAAKKKPSAKKAAARPTVAKRGKRGGKKSSASKKRSTGRSPRAGALVPAQMKKTALKVLAGAAAGAVRAIIPPLEQAVASNEAAAGVKKSDRGKREDSDD